MDLHLKQWRNQVHDESDKQPSAKIRKLLLDDPHHHHHHHHGHQQEQHDQHQQISDGSSALPLFAPELNSKVSTNSNQLSAAALSDSNTRFCRMGSYFSLAQWQELELQALIYRYMLAGAAVPPELLQPIKKSLLNSPTYFLHHSPQHYSHYQPAWYWGRSAMDPEPCRCRRTDGKKWRCARDVVAGHKYCERHLHRGRNRSRKPVEMPTTSTIKTNNNVTAAFGGASVAGVGATGCGALKASSQIVTASPLAVMANGPNRYGLSGPSPPIDLLHCDHSSSEPKSEYKGLFEAQNEVNNRSAGHILRPFFDDWPRSLEEPHNAEGGTNASPLNSGTSLSISMPGNSSSDVSLKLYTGNADLLGQRESGKDQPQLNWTAGWASNHAAPMGGPLAEALRSSSNSSPTSVLHQLHRARGSASETSFAST